MVILIMGVAGSGKTTIGECLATELGWQFADADTFHPPSNVAKMRQGIALSDVDRLPWLETMQQTISTWLQTGTHAVLACSALKQNYRNLLCQDSAQVKLVYLQGAFTLIQQRLNQRQGHYMKAELLASQFDTLEEPTDALVVKIDQAPEAIVQQIRQALGL